jgi:DNA polymerase III delta subunit
MYKLLLQANRFSMDELVGTMERLLDLDIQLKSGVLEPERLVESVLFDLCLGNHTSPPPMGNTGARR